MLLSISAKLPSSDCGLEMGVINSILALNVTDYIIIAVILFSILISLLRGFVREAVSLLTWIVAFWIAFKFSGVATDLFSSFGYGPESPKLRLILCFAILFIAMLFLGFIVNSLLSRFIAKTGLTGLDRMIGMVFGALRGTLVVGVLLLLCSVSIVSKEAWWKNSVLVPHFSVIISFLHDMLPDQLDGVKQPEVQLQNEL